MVSRRTVLAASAGFMLAAAGGQGPAQAAGIKDWLQNRLTIAEAEAVYGVKDDRLGPNPVPFGFQNDKWRALVAEMQDGDELWEFSSPPESWQNLAGRAGVALIRRGEVVRSIVTTMN
jgi:hypothetical protein